MEDHLSVKTLRNKRAEIAQIEQAKHDPLDRARVVSTEPSCMLQGAKVSDLALPKEAVAHE
jgi:hypothetical protein